MGNRDECPRPDVLGRYISSTAIVWRTWVSPQTGILLMTLVHSLLPCGITREHDVLSSLPERKWWQQEASQLWSSARELRAPCPAPLPCTAFPRGPCSSLQGTGVAWASSQAPAPPRHRMNSHREREKKIPCIGTQAPSTDNVATRGETERARRDPPKGTQSSPQQPDASPGLWRFETSPPLLQTMAWPRALPRAPQSCSHRRGS